MKLTWFGGTTLRVYVGGDIVVIDPGHAPAGVSRSEVLAGADHVADFGDRVVPLIDPATWRPKPAPRAIDASAPPIEVVRIAEETLLIAAAGEPPLVVLGGGAAPRFGRWADGAVIVLTSAREALVAEATVLLDVARPRLIALAFEAETLDTVVAELGEHLQGTGLVSLEPGLALEV
jgi:hypothetical protein